MVNEAHEIANDVKHWIVILEVPVEPNEAPPHEWDWNTLIDTSHDIKVVGAKEMPY